MEQNKPDQEKKDLGEKVKANMEKAAQYEEDLINVLEMIELHLAVMVKILPVILPSQISNDSIKQAYKEAREEAVEDSGESEIKDVKETES